VLPSHKLGKAASGRLRQHCSAYNTRAIHALGCSSNKAGIEWTHFIPSAEIWIGGATFEILKFRTMYHNRSDAAGVIQAKANDSRVTPLGAWLRRTNIDELPQLINVLHGDMSLVGPRPHVRGMLAGGVPYEVLVPHYFDRCRTLPGLTGLAQVTGLRGSTRDARLAIDRIERDLAYIRNRSILLDVRILFYTLFNECARSSGC
jgi:lipopolysaccharide/colanic/teichoic acid biosynthesis glycosyltransferase